MIEEKNLPWQEILEIFFRQRLPIIALIVLGTGLGAIAAVLEPPIFEAKAKVLLTEKAVSGPREEAGSDTQIKAELHHLKSPALVRAVLEFYDEIGQPLGPKPPPIDAFKRSWRRKIKRLIGKVHDTPTAANIDLRIEEVLPRIVPRSIAGTNVIEIAIASSDPQWAAGFVNDLIDQHIKRIAKFNEETRASSFYNEQRNLLFVRWKEAQDALTEFLKRYDGDLLAGDEEHLRKVLSQLEAGRVETGTQVLEHQAKIDYLDQQLEALPDTIAAESRFTEDDSVKFLKAHILDLETKRSELLSRYTPTSIRVKELERQIAESKELLVSKKDEKLEEVMKTPNPAYQTLRIDAVQTTAKLVSAQARVQALDAQIQDYRGKLSRLEGLATERQRLKNDVKNKEEAHQTYLQKEEEARLSSSLDESGIVNLAIFERAEVPVTPEPTKAKMMIAAGAVAGLLLGLILAVLRDFIDPTVKSSAQAFRLAGAPILAEVPRP